MARPPDELVFSRHALQQMARRSIAEDDVRLAIRTAEQSWEVRPGRAVFQTLRDFGQPPKNYLLRVFVDLDREPAEVVTVYRTSKISRYSQQP